MSLGQGTPDPSMGRGLSLHPPGPLFSGGPLWAVLPSPAATGAGGRPGMNAPLRGITPCQGPVLLGTCAHQDLWLLGDTSAPLWYPLAWRDWHRDSSVSHWAQGQLSVLLGNNFMPLSDTGTAQCPHWAQGQLCPHWAWGQLSVPESALCPHWAGDSWNGCVTPRSVTLLVVLSPPHPTGGLGWCWGTDRHSGDPESHHGPVAWAHWCPHTQP